MGIKIKKGSEPIGTRHVVPTFIGGKGLTQPVYAVYAVRGAGTAMPSDGITIFLKYASGKSPYTYPPTMCVTLEYLASDCPPETEEDTFWEDGKSVMI